MTINVFFQAALDEATEPWGIKVERVEMWVGYNPKNNFLTLKLSSLQQGCEASDTATEGYGRWSWGCPRGQGQGLRIQAVPHSRMNNSIHIRLLLPKENKKLQSPWPRLVKSCQRLELLFNFGIYRLATLSFIDSNSNLSIFRLWIVLVQRKIPLSSFHYP